MTNKTLQEELERLMDAYWGKSGHNLPVERPIYSAAILALFQSRLDSIEWPRERTIEQFPETIDTDWIEKNPHMSIDLGFRNGYNKAIEACQQAVKKAFGEIS